MLKSLSLLLVLALSAASLPAPAHATTCTLSDLAFEQQVLSWFEAEIAPDLNQVNCYATGTPSGTCTTGSHLAIQYDCATANIGTPPPTSSTPRYWRLKDGISCDWYNNHIQDMHARVEIKPNTSWQFLRNAYCACGSTWVSCQWVL